MPLQATSGAASYDAFGGGAAAAIPYTDDVFSTYIYTGTGASQTITNGIDLSGKGGLVWIKGRSGATAHALYDTARGATFEWVSNTTAAQTTQATGLTSFGSTGFSIGALAKLNTNTATYNSWTFRKQPKFFDIVTYTGTGATGQVISHNLGSVPGCIIIKRTSAVAEPYVWHRNLTSTSYALLLNDTSAEFTSGGFLTGTPTSTTFSLTPPSAFDPNGVNGNGSTYVAYLFAHDAGGFGLAGTDNVISCGTYTGNGTTNGPTVTVGFEPQWVMIKAKNATANFIIVDTMRGFSVAGNTMGLFPNLALAENDAGTSRLTPTATGFKLSAINVDTNALNNEYIYIAIRSGPMKVPTVGTSVFSPTIWTGNGVTGRSITTGFTVDLTIEQLRTNSGAFQPNLWFDRLRGYSSTAAVSSSYLRSQVTDAEASLADYNYVPTMDGFNFGSVAGIANQLNGTTVTSVGWNFKRAPSFFDEVCYTGTGSNTTITHNLTAVPELIIIKRRNAIVDWQVYSSGLANTEYLVLNTTAAKATGATRWNSTTPTSSVFSLGTSTEVNTSAATYVAYLFATCAGVSKVGTYTGNGSSQTINCGFTGGARFILIKRTSAVGDWYVWDTARGIVAGNDPYLSLNTTVAEVTSDDTIDTDSTGFIVNQLAATNVNVTSATYVFLAIA
jgi:hypothetical protein